MPPAARQDPTAQLSLFEEWAPPAATPPQAGAPARPAVPASQPAPAPAPRGSEVAAPSLLRHPRAEREVRLDGHLVAFAFKRARRRSIGFVIGPEGLSVSAPRWVGLAEVDAALKEKARWILRKLQEQQQRAQRLDQARVDWRDGVGIPFLGETVIVVLDPRATGAVLNAGAEALPGVPRLALHVGLPQSAQPDQIRDVVQSWLQRQARRVFEERCALFAQALNVRIKRLSLSSASTRWGSASADGAIRLNWRLVHFGLPVIDYVVTHELAHLREMNHSPAFWDVVRSVLPNFEQARVHLRDEVLPVLD
ncbi:putative metal-dependent hydrolase [Burkholderiales bacterium JOSHI_001]|nr:putative metal-dependent hydrolase [Burkholderiales bacterium JOSHI_001]